MIGNEWFKYAFFESEKCEVRYWAAKKNGFFWFQVVPLHAENG